jgi:bifunctional polynucleotide phosphatase/kinase
MSSASRKRRNSNEERVSPPPSKRALKQMSTITSESASVPLIYISLTIAEQAVQNFFTPSSQKLKDEKLSWRIVDGSLIVGRYRPTASTANGQAEATTLTGRKKIAAFDFDSTLISTISKAKFARDANDWCWWHGSVPGKLKALHDEGYRLVILSNQGGISLKSANGPKLKNDRFIQFKQKAGAVFNNLNLPIGIYAGTEKDQFRKPMTGMWTEFLKDEELQDKDIDLLHSVFVGDAGGRIAGTNAGKSVKADFACSDRNFAANVGMSFQSPEEFFLDQPARAFLRSIDTSVYAVSNPEAAKLYRSKFTKRASPEIVVFVGSPGAGKSTFYRTYFEPLGYVRANQDTLKSVSRCSTLNQLLIFQSAKDASG